VRLKRLPSLNIIPADQDPVPVHKRTWTPSIFILYWFSDLITVAGWAGHASVFAVGLTASDAIWITLVAGICNAIPTGK
jgi:nucleobase:cation symporter-1, NCS1 family